MKTSWTTAKGSKIEIEQCAMTRQSPTKRTLHSFKLSASTRQQLETLAEKERRSMAQVIEIAVNDYYHKEIKMAKYGWAFGTGITNDENGGWHIDPPTEPEFMADTITEVMEHRSNDPNFRFVREGNTLYQESYFIYCDGTDWRTEEQGWVTLSASEAAEIAYNEAD